MTCSLQSWGRTTDLKEIERLRKENQQFQRRLESLKRDNTVLLDTLLVLLKESVAKL